MLFLGKRAAWNVGAVEKNERTKSGKPTSGKNKSFDFFDSFVSIAVGALRVPTSHSPARACPDACPRLRPHR
jgi:hypothetical protein